MYNLNSLFTIGVLLFRKEANKSSFKKSTFNHLFYRTYLSRCVNEKWSETWTFSVVHLSVLFPSELKHLFELSSTKREVEVQLSDLLHLISSISSAILNLMTRIPVGDQSTCSSVGTCKQIDTLILRQWGEGSNPFSTVLQPLVISCTFICCLPNCVYTYISVWLGSIMHV